MLKDFKPRLYQETIFATCAQSNTLVVLPTGMGKTNLAVMVAAQRLSQYPHSKILILAPTKPLVEQIMNRFIRHLDINEESITMFTGAISPKKREALWKTSQVISSTPQGLENDIISRRIDLKDVSLIIFDEAHRAVGDYSYVWVAKQYARTANYPRILALTASPGSDLEKINEVISNLHVEEIEVRVDTDPDVKPYVQEIEVNWIKVSLPVVFKETQKYIKDCFQSKLREIANNGFFDTARIASASRYDLLKLQGTLQGEVAQGNRDPLVFRSLSLAAGAMKIQHALELLETQSISALHKYMANIFSQARTSKVKAVQDLVQDINFKSAFFKVNKLIEEKIKHPKLNKLIDMVETRIGDNPDTKLIIFTQYRDSGSQIVEEINRIKGISSKLFVGQAKKSGTGLSQKEQIAMLDEFRRGDFNVLVSSSVGEEGLDIPQVDLVIFYEPIPSAVRHIQRRGRTGRQEKGEVMILMVEGTRDEGYRWSAHHKERRMYRTLKELKSKIKLTPKDKPKTKTLDQFSSSQNNSSSPFSPTTSFSGSSTPHTSSNASQSSSNNQTKNTSSNKVKVFADYREKGSGVIKELIELNADLSLERLESSDYLLSKDVAIEYKTQEDFVDSLIDGRLLSQLKTMKNSFHKPLVMVEGDRDIFSIRNLNPNSIRGMIATVAVSFGIPIIYTKNFKDSAAMIYAIAKREQDEKGREFSLHGSKKSLDVFAQQEYVVSSLPGVGPGLAKPLLRKFKNVTNIVTASKEELKEVDLIGDIKANRIREVLDNDYREF